MKKVHFLLLAFCIGLFTSVYGQVTTSSLSGRTIDNSGILPGAIIQARHEPSGTTYQTVANEDGRFLIQGMRTGGPYTVVVSLIGYNKYTQNNINLRLGETYDIQAIALSSSDKELGEVVVTANRRDIFDGKKTGAASNFSTSQINNTASVSRSVYDVTKLVPQASVTGSGMSFAGSNNRYNSFQIDGTVNNDVFGLSSSGTNGGQAGANPISLDAIEEIQVVIAPFDVRQSGFTGGGINAITKSGTNTFHGSAYGYYNNQNFIGKTPGDVSERSKLGDQSSKTYGATFGGPIIKNKLFFFGNVEQVKETYPSTNNIGTQSSSLNTGEVDQIVSKIKDLTGGYDGGGYGSQDIDTKSTKVLGRIDWNINAHNKFTARYSYLDGRKLVFSNKPAAALLNNSGYYMNNKTHSFVAELNSTFNEAWSNEFRFGYTRVQDSRDAVGQAMPYVTIKNLTGGTSLSFGTETYSTANSLDQDIFTLTNNLSWVKGNHVFTFGTHNEFFNMKNLFIANNYGSYVYSSLNDFLTVGTTTEVLPESYSYSYSREDITGTKKWAPEFGAAQLGFYAQDDWTISNKFKLTYGLRADIPIFFDKPRANEVFNNSETAQEHNLATDQMPKTRILWSPRVGFRYNVDEENKTILRGGVGIFTGRVPFVWVSNSFSNTGVEYARTSMSKAADFPSDFKFNADPSNQYVKSGTLTSEVDVMNKNFKFPSVFRANLAVDQILPGGVKGSLEAMYSKTLNNILYENLNYQQNGTLDRGGDNRPIYSKVDPNFTQIVYLKNTSKGFTYNVTAKLEKEFDFGLDIMAAYTYGKAKSLNDGSSSQAYSNWKYNTTYYGDAKPELTYSSFDVRNRIIASVSYTKEYARNMATTVSLFYNGQNGGRYSLIYSNDLNGDGYAGNDLLYIPTDEELAGMTFTDISKGATGTEQKEAFAAWINSNKELRDSKGTHMKRNQMRMPFEHHFDFHIAQQFFMNVAGRRHTLEVTFDILNVGNLFNKKWGMYNQTTTGYDLTPVKTTTAAGVTTYNFYDPGKMYTNTDITSRWRSQIGLRYIF